MIHREPQFDANGQQIGELIRCTPNNEYQLSEAEQKYCNDFMFRKFQREDPQGFWKIVEQERAKMLGASSNVVEDTTAGSSTTIQPHIGNPNIYAFFFLPFIR
jgi:hypothetical protein